MLKRAFSMLRYNDFALQNRSSNTSIAPTINFTPGYKHELEITGEAESVLSLELSELSERISFSGSARASTDGRGLEVTADGSSRLLFVIPQVAVEKNTDHLLIVRSFAPTGKATIRIIANDPRIVLGAGEIETKDKKPKDTAVIGADDEQYSFDTKIPFASGDVGEVTLSFASSDAQQPPVQISGIELFSFGATPNLWTRHVRVPLGAIQKNVFKTKHLLPLNIIGILLLVAIKRWATLVILLAIPVYYLVFQSVFHTEYRYILAIHYFLFVMGATSLFLAGKLAIQAGRRIRRTPGAGSKQAQTAD
jgi:hypothetical protein